MAFLTKRYGKYYICWIDDSQNRHFLSTKTKSKADAAAVLRKFYTEGNTHNERKKILLADYITEFMKITSQTRTPSTMRLYEYILKSFLAETGNKLMNLIGINEIEKYRIKKNETLNETSMNIHLRHIKAFIHKAFDSKYIYRDWYKNITFKKLSDKRRIPIPREDINIIIEKATEPVMKEIITYGYMTGSRRNEIVNQTWENIDFDGMIISIINNKTFKTKTKKNRIIPINRPLAEMLRNKFYQEQIINKKEYVFRYNDKQVSIGYVTKYFKRLVRRYGFDEDITFHSLRHSFITNLIVAGTDINTVKELAGHNNISTTIQYIHTTNEIKRRAVELL